MPYLACQPTFYKKLDQKLCSIHFGQLHGSWPAQKSASHEILLYAVYRLSTGRKTLGERRCRNAEPYNKTYDSEDDAGDRSERVSYQPVVAKSLNTSYSYAVDMFSKRGSIILLAVL